MTKGAREIEARFFVEHLDVVRRRLEDSGGRILKPRVHELNLRFDTPDGQLQSAGSALRLRRDAGIHITLKGSTEFHDGARSRTELELDLDDFDKARQLLQALGYVVIFKYEKFRTTYQLDRVEVMLDELPIGDFVEIEGDLEALRPAAEQLHLDWSAAIEGSYHSLFARLQQSMRLTFRDLLFRNFEGRPALTMDLGLRPTDL